MRLFWRNKLFTVGILSFLLLVIGVLFAVPARASSPQCSGGGAIMSGRKSFCGYFDNNYQQFGNFVLSGGLYSSVNEASFVAQIESYLSGAYGQQDRTGAEFIIDTMVGLPGGASRNVGTTNCVNGPSTSVFCDWKNRVLNYSNGSWGSVTWRQAITVSGNQCNGSSSANVNTFWQPSYDDDAYFRDNDCTTHGVSSLTKDFIVFRNKDNSIAYQLRVECGNPYGILNGLKNNTPPQGSIKVVNCTTVSVKLWDPDAPTSAIQYYLVVSGGPQQGPFTFGGQNAAPAQRSVNSYPNFNYWQQNGVSLIGVDVQTGGQYNLGSATLPVCGSISCTGSMTTLPGTMVAGENTAFKVWVVVNNAPSGPPGARFTSVTMKTPSGRVDTIVPPPAGGLTYSGTSQLIDNASPSLSYTPSAAGKYTLSWTFGGGQSNPASVTCAPPAGVASSQAAYEPYFTALGSDVSAGQGFGSACTDTKINADIMGYNLDGGGAAPNYFGASSRQGAIATGNITQFATDITNNTATNLGGSTNGLTALTTNSPPKGLAFANTTSSGLQYGGNMLQGAVSTQWCVPDYEGTASAPGGAFNPANITSGTYTLSGTTLGNIVIPQGVRVTIIATGSIYINGPITYQSYGGGPANIPQLTLLVKGGNIYIDQNVQELHGFYAAQAKGANTGIIYTCATGLNAPSLDYNGCNHPITFYGSVAASEIVPGRTAGNIAKTSSVSDYPAEQFVFTPELWLSGVTGVSTSCASDPTQVGCLYQAYTSLPPVL